MAAGGPLRESVVMRHAVYLSGRSGRRLELLAYAEALRGDGHAVTSRWLTGSGEGLPEAAAAAADLTDLERAGTLLAFSEGYRVEDGAAQARGGRHVEFGYALCWGLRVLLVGPREHAFHFLPQVRQFDTFAAARAWLREAQDAPAADEGAPHLEAHAARYPDEDNR